eukprot:SAG11_NODE_213_length_12262_cov_8.391597_6_plen_262_part_00
MYSDIISMHRCVVHERDDSRQGALRILFPIARFDSTQSSIHMLRAMNAIIASSPLQASIYSDRLLLYGMFDRLVGGIMNIPLLAALMGSFIALLCMMPSSVVAISLATVNVAVSDVAVVLIFDKYLGPFTFAIVVISMGLCLRYSIHMAHVFLDAEGGETVKERFRAALLSAGKALFDGSWCFIMAIAILSGSVVENSTVYGSGLLFCYMTALCLFHGHFVVPVVLSLTQLSTRSRVSPDSRSQGWRGAAAQRSYVVAKQP